MKVDVLGGNPLPNCPFTDSSLPPSPATGAVLHFPTVSLTYFVFFASFTVQGLRILLKYNEVKIFNRKIDHPSVKNSEYYCMFFALAISFLIDGIRYALDFPISLRPDYFITEEQWIARPHIIDAWLLLGSSIFRNVGLLFLSLGLNQQIIYRSKPASLITSEEEEEEVFFSPASDAQEEAAPLLDSVQVISDEQRDVEVHEEEIFGFIPKKFVVDVTKVMKSTIMSSKFLIWVFFLIRVLLVIISTGNEDLVDDPRSLDIQDTSYSPVASWISGFVQVGLLFYLCWLVISSPGPRLYFKISLILSAVVSLIFWLEPSVVNRFVLTVMKYPQTQNLCIVPPWWWQKVKGTTIVIPAHGWASYIDVLQWIGAIGLHGFFSFMRSEFTRNSEAWIALTVSQVQNEFDFRRT